MSGESDMIIAGILKVEIIYISRDCEKSIIPKKEEPRVYYKSQGSSFCYN